MMRRILHVTEPLVWLLFGAGFMVVSFVFPALAFILGVGDLFGWLPEQALRFERVAAVVAHPLVGSAVLSIAVLALWNGVFHFRHASMDLLGTASDRIVGPIYYGIGAIGTAWGATALFKIVAV